MSLPISQLMSVIGGIANASVDPTQNVNPSYGAIQGTPDQYTQHFGKPAPIPGPDGTIWATPNGND